MKSNSKSGRTMIRKRRIILLTLLFLLLTTTASIYSESLSKAWHNCLVNYRLHSWFRYEDPKNYVNKKKILFWNTMFGDEWFYMGKDKHFEGCPKYENCYATNWRWMINVTDFDAILFHVNEMSPNDLPELRDSKQLYVYANLENPIVRSISSNFVPDNFFNLTMTYKLDSDIPWPYRMITNIDGDREYVAPSKNGVTWKEPSLDLLRRKLDTKVDKKGKIAAWFVSNCETPAKRELFVQELSKHVDVDVMGSCAGWSAPSCSLSRDCFADIVEPNYFFYLAFENALCEDYVTEKLYNALR